MNDSHAEHLINRAIEIGYYGMVNLELIAQGAVWLVIDGPDGSELARHSSYLSPGLSASVLLDYLN
jgi:hypothetical protein